MAHGIKLKNIRKRRGYIITFDNIDSGFYSFSDKSYNNQAPHTNANQTHNENDNERD